MTDPHYLADLHLRSPDGTDAVVRVAVPPGYRMLPEDDPTRPYYRPCAERVVGFETGLFGGGRAGGRTRVGKGDLVLRNGDRWFDAYGGWAWRRAVVWQIPQGRFVPWANAVRRFAGSIRRVDYDDDGTGAGEVLVRLADPQSRFDRTVMRGTYGGSSVGPIGIDGGSDLRNTDKPVTLGRCFGVSGVLVNRQLQIRQYNDGPVSALVPKVGGAVVPVSADVGAAITDPALSVPVGGAVTDLSRGLCRLGFVPSKTATADVDGDMPAGGPWPSSAAHLARHLAVTRLGLAAGAVDAASVAALHTAWPAPCGLVLDSAAGGLDTLDQLLAAAGGGWWTLGFDDRFALGALEPGAGHDLEITDADRAVTVVRRTSEDPWADDLCWRVEVYHSLNNTPLSDDQIVSSLSDAEKDRLRGRYPAPAVAEDPAILTAYPQLADRSDGGVLKVETALQDATAAQALAARLLSQRRPGGATFAATLDAGRAGLVAPGSRVRLARSALGLSAGLVTRVIHLSTEDGVTYQALLWGRP